MKMEQTECSETSAYKFQRPGNHPKESIQQTYINLCNNGTFPIVFIPLVHRQVCIVTILSRYFFHQFIKSEIKHTKLFQGVM